MNPFSHPWTTWSLHTYADAAPDPSSFSRPPDPPVENPDPDQALRQPAPAPRALSVAVGVLLDRLLYLGSERFADFLAGSVPRVADAMTDTESETALSGQSAMTVDLRSRRDHIAVTFLLNDRRLLETEWAAECRLLGLLTLQGRLAEAGWQFGSEHVRTIGEAEDLLTALSSGTPGPEASAVATPQ